MKERMHLGRNMNRMMRQNIRTEIEGETKEKQCTELMSQTNFREAPSYTLQTKTTLIG